MQKDEEELSFEDIAKKLESAIGSGTLDSLANGKVNEITKDDYMEVLRKPRTALVEFYTPTCPYCKQLLPILEELAEEYRSKIFFAKINIREIDDVAHQFDVAGVPLLIAFKKGSPVARLEGLRNYKELDDWIDSIQKGLKPMGIDPGPTTTYDFKLDL
ncbi:MAG: thioredoxin family protein [Candidatus Hodarchaeota archaeon]